MEDHQSNESGPKSSRLSAAWLIGAVILGIVLCAISFFYDRAVIDWVNTHDSRPLKELAGFLSRWGDWPELMTYGVIGLGVSWLAGNRRLFKVLLCMMCAATLAGAVVNSVRLVSGRARPNNTEATQEWNGLWRGSEFLLFKNKYHSFPSGHCGAAFAFFGVAVFADYRYWWLLLAAAAIAWSRIYLNVHHLSDVFVGAFAGLLTAAVVWRWFRARIARGRGSSFRLR
jgi:membrane-associated phospholipid phosphatase